MMTMIAKNLLERLYLNKRLSVAEIAKELDITYPTAVYWVRKHRIPTRADSERMYAKLNPDGDPFSPKKRLSRREQELLCIGLALYWGEGSRKSRHTIKLANLDHRMLCLFARFLREIAGVQESRLRLDVRVFRAFSQSAARRYWAHALAISPAQVFVYPHTDQRSRVGQQWSPYGIATVSISNTKLKAWIDGQLEAVIRRFMRPSSKHPSATIGPPAGTLRDGVGVYMFDGVRPKARTVLHR